MPDDKREPQSYGSQADWVTGNVGEEVNRQKGHPSSQHGDFYEPRRDGEETGAHQGGHVSPLQASESVRPSPPVSGEDVDEPSRTKVRGRESGATRDSYFKKRDYD